MAEEGLPEDGVAIELPADIIEGLNSLRGEDETLSDVLTRVVLKIIERGVRK